MRTTIELPDALFAKAKLVAKQRRQTLKALIAEALQKDLMGAPSKTRMDRPPISDQGVVIPSLTNAEIAALEEAELLAKIGL